MPDYIRLKKGEERRIRQGHPWIFSNEIDTTATPLKLFTQGQEVQVQSANNQVLGSAYINPQSLICARLFSHEANQALDQPFILEKLKKALALRESLYSDPYYRLIFSEGDYLPGLIIDRFCNDFVMQTNTYGIELKIPEIMAALQALFPDINSIYLHNDSSVRQYEGLQNYTKLAFGTAPDDLDIIENGVTFKAPLAQGQKTGWFYDHRENRHRLTAYVKNKRVLDVFSYVGGWGVQAATYGATSVMCIDVSSLACNYVTTNAALNQVDVSVIESDVFDAFKRLKQDGQKYDLIILDPPAFIKKAKDRKEGIVAYQRINEAAFKLLDQNGILFSCSCSMHISWDDLLGAIRRAAFNTGRTIQILEHGHQAPDHPIHPAIPETSYLKCIVVRCL